MSTIEELTQRLMAHKTGEMASLMLHLGLHPRWVLEWLRQQTTSGILRHVDEEQFELPEEMAGLLLDIDENTYLGWVFGEPLAGRAIDVGCDGGIAIAELAKAFPEASFVGIDPSSTAVERARAHASEEGVSNLELHVASAEDLEDRGLYDFAMVVDCMHDMTHPQDAANAIRRASRTTAPGW